MNHNARDEPSSVWLASRPWRQGRRVGRNIYAVVADQPADDDVAVGSMDSEWLAAEAVFRHNLRFI